MEYRIVLTRMEFHALHGCYELERKVGNRFTVDLEITAELGRTEVKLQDAYFLNIGDVIDLGHPKDEPIYLYIGGKPWFGGKLGVQNNSMAVKIGENYYNEGRRDE